MSVLSRGVQPSRLLNLPRAARSSLRPHHHLRQQHPPHRSASSSSSSSSSSQYHRSQFKILPFIAIFALGSGSYALLVKSRTGVRKPSPDTDA
ncbi:hypothetical protein AFLA_131430 [Aspergillus terreus]|uniref:Uncharacterized protein n=1 Tax=Aspergillus terreus TaxID=33178 RepID=A0A5M3Z2T5_ASPTE|nr:hypothetical protein ATETN484_0008031700 [Aspergillus terreus]GFF13608.1 hypothetical protein AFLA_131430 [Aspergillus terreus]